MHRNSCGLIFGTTDCTDYTDFSFPIIRVIRAIRGQKNSGWNRRCPLQTVNCLPAHRRRATLLSRALVLLACGWLGAAALAQSDIEQSVKAGYLYNFAKFTDWPTAKFGQPAAPLVIGCFSDATFATALDHAVAGKAVGARRIVVRRVTGAEEIGGCHILFVGHAQRDGAGPLLAKSKELNVLTVGEADGFLSRGGMINFYMEQDNVRIEASPKTAERAGLKLSSRLLSVARIAN